MSDYRHRCTTAECPYLGQLTDNLSCGCHRKEAEIMREKLALLTTPRPIAEYHEDMGPVLWWCWVTKDRRLLRERPEKPYTPHWLGEPPYVGSPSDLGKEVFVKTSIYTVTALEPTGEKLKFYDGDDHQRVNIGGWPGYHTHFTPLPLMPEIPNGPVAKA